MFCAFFQFCKQIIPLKCYILVEIKIEAIKRFYRNQFTTMTKKQNYSVVINVQDVHKSFKEVHAVRGLSFDIKPGEFVALLGPNGAGKTTMVEMIEGIQTPDAGKIFIQDKNWGNSKRNELNKILGISLQETWFIEKLTVWETLQLFASFYKLPDSRVGEVVELVDLGEKVKAYVKNLSGGQKQRLSLGISLINHPEILLLDEPTTGLDPMARRGIWNILKGLKENNNTTMVLTTHYMEEAEQLCDKIILIDHGKILAQGTLDDLLSQCGFNEIIEIDFDQKEVVDFNAINGMVKVLETPKGYMLEVGKIVDALPLILEMAKQKGLNISNLECRKVTLDDLFISITGRHLID